MGKENPLLRIAGIEPESFVDGPGIRLTIFTQGCNHHCMGCHNPETHDFSLGYDIELEKIIEMIKENPLLDGVTFSGGDPMDQAKALVPLAKEIKQLGLNLIIYTGYLYENLLEMSIEKKEIIELLSYTDILVDGPFILAKKSLELKFRGSINQRLIDVSQSLSTGKVILHTIQLQEMQEHLDWNF